MYKRRKFGVLLLLAALAWEVLARPAQLFCDPRGPAVAGPEALEPEPAWSLSWSPSPSAFFPICCCCWILS